jgi:uncharacterized repeat protein (TIGR04138 family)
MQTLNFEEELEKIVARDDRYHRDAYLFVREALDHTQRMGGRPPAKNEIRHVSGQQLLEGAREYALAQYGPMTLSVLNEWGIRCCTDIGEIVFNMVQSRLLAKTEQDRLDDFKSGYDFDDAFRKPFLPTGKALKASSEPSTA